MCASVCVCVLAKVYVSILCIYTINFLLNVWVRTFLSRSVCIFTNAIANGTEYDCGGCVFAFLHHRKIDNVNERMTKKKNITHAYNNVSEFELRENRKRHFRAHNAFSLTESKPNSSLLSLSSTVKEKWNVPPLLFYRNALILTSSSKFRAGIFNLYTCTLCAYDSFHITNMHALNEA